MELNINRDSRENLFADTFKPEQFVRDLSSQCIGAEELRKRRCAIQDLADETSARLKHNVYQNYTEFIGTSREILYLESEMYQLSQFLGEQRSLLNASVAHTKLDSVITLGPETVLQYPPKSPWIPDSEEKPSKHLGSGERSLIIDTTDRICLHEGPLQELDQFGGISQKRVYAYLLNDVLVIALSPLMDSRDFPKYRSQVVYDIQNSVLINVKDLGNMKFAFKLSSPSGSRIFQCTSASSKKEWMDKFEHMKRLSYYKTKAMAETNPTIVMTNDPYPKLKTHGLKSPVSDSGSHHSTFALISEIEEVLDSHLAERDHMEAYKTLNRMDCQHQNIKSRCNEDFEDSVEIKTTELIISLMKQFESITEARSLQIDDLKRYRKICHLLIRLNRSAQACELFLRLCSAALRIRVSRVKKEGPTSSYIRSFSAVSLDSVAKIWKEFSKIFPGSVNCISAFIVWSFFEWDQIIAHMSKQIFIPQVPWTVLIECINIIHEYSDQIIHVGLDFMPRFDERSNIQLVKILKETGEKYFDYIHSRILEEDWDSTSIQNSNHMDELMNRYDHSRRKTPVVTVEKSHQIMLTYSVKRFSKTILELISECLVIMTPQTYPVIESTLGTVLAQEIEHLQSALSNPQLQDQVGLIQRKITNMRDDIIPQCLKLMQRATSRQSHKLMMLKEDLQSSDIPAGTRLRQSARTSIPKYSTLEYI